ncbi:hypothetical protein HYT55_02625 [Candidatus Woesearchaeota archaeon]|nr:hypothetical protein [Candidatus Woesearchaeota archaeon]
MVDDRRLYFVPVREVCNADCTFCYMNEKAVDEQKPQFIPLEKLIGCVASLQGKFNQVEITGGGEPTLHPKLPEILRLFENTYRKMYTNGFHLRNLPPFEEVNISRVHWDSVINNQYYRSRSQNELSVAIDHYRGIAERIRIQTILLRGAIDSREKLLDFVTRYEEKVDVFMFRTLFPKCSLEKAKMVTYEEVFVKHPKVVFDKTLDDYSRPLYFIGTDCNVHETFQF